jgi:hypothetical protein
MEQLQYNIEPLGETGVPTVSFRLPGNRSSGHDSPTGTEKGLPDDHGRKP